MDVKRLEMKRESIAMRAIGILALSCSSGESFRSNVHEALRRFEFPDNNDPDGHKTDILENYRRK